MMYQFQKLSYEEMQERNGGSKWGWLAKWAGAAVVSHCLGLPGGFAFAYLMELCSNEEEANRLAAEYYKDCSRPNYNTD